MYIWFWSCTEQQPFNMDRLTEERLSRLSDVGVKFALER